MVTGGFAGCNWYGRGVRALRWRQDIGTVVGSWTRKEIDGDGEDGEEAA